MLYNYPPEATTRNWLHWCLVQMLMQLHSHTESNQTPPEWPDIIPYEYRDKLNTRDGLRDRLRAYTRVLATLTVAEQQSVRETLVRQNQLRRLLCGRRDGRRIGALPMKIRKPLKNLFDFAFTLLTDLGIRDDHYKIIYNSNSAKLCPFCGLEYFDAPGGPREDDDHYLPKKHYPFAAANLWNLVPMGHKCNSKYKKTNDPIMDKVGAVRRAVNPYGIQCFTVSLLGTVMTHAPKRIRFAWSITFEPSIEEAETWNAIFDLRKRYRRDILEPHWKTWLERFADFAEVKNVRDDTALRDVLKRYCRIQRRAGLDDRSFLKAAFFEMLLHQWDSGNQAIRRILKSITSLSSGTDA